MDNLSITQFKAGQLVQRFEYQSFTPTPICRQWQVTQPDLLALMSEADRAIGRLDAFADLIPDTGFFIKMHITKEATVSSKIEGTQTSFEEALWKAEDLRPDKRDDWQEVHNYIEAMKKAIDSLSLLPISNRLLRQTHAILMQGVRGHYKQPGEFRTSQNWIGATLKDAIFVPPTHEEVPALMHDLEQFINAEVSGLPIQVPHLIKAAIIHYQFETIHPFLDGNGRLGRLLITLYLINKKVLSQPTLYLSDFFERNRRLYYDYLTAVRQQNDLHQWIKFFLAGVVETAQSSVATLQQIVALRNDVELNRLIKLGRKQKDAKKLIDELYKQPIMDAAGIAEAMGVHVATANRMIADFVALGILKELTGFKRNRIYAFQEYIQLF
jgi:Fic family protein